MQTDFSGWSKALPETGLNKISHLDSEDVMFPQYPHKKATGDLIQWFTDF